jgi:PAS domain S-box-containing protein
MNGRILFFDNDHQVSRIAEFLINKKGIPGIEIESAGKSPLENESFKRKCIQSGMEWTAPRDFESTCQKKYDIVITLSDKDDLQKAMFPGIPPVLHWKIDLLDAILFEWDGVIQNLDKKIEELFRYGFLQALIYQKTYLHDLLDSLHDGVMVHDLNRKVILFSKEAERLTGMTKDVIYGTDCHDLFQPHLCGENCAFCGEQCDFSSLKKSTYPAVFTSPDGTRKDFEITRIPFRDEIGNVIGAIATFKDATRLKELELRLGEVQSFSGIIGQDHKMLAVYELVKDVGQSDFPVIVTGESGTGKELVAAALHSESSRRDKLFVPVNCGALPEGTLESELFGHVKGAFTGAIRDKKGRFELADKGTLFLDEIAELSVRMQVKLLRVLQEGVFEPVGSEHQKRVDVRIICATNKNLKEMVAAGTFREDLYYRLSVVPIELPPLRERRNDIALLAQHFLEKNLSKLSKSKMYFSEETLSFLMNYQWPGNVRQLQNSVQFTLIKCRGTIIYPEHLPPEIIASSFVPAFLPRIPGKAGRKPKLSLDIVERALQKAGGNKAKAARYLGVGRATLYNFMNGNKNILEEVE